MSADLSWLDKHIAEQQASHLEAGITPEMFSQLCEDLERLEYLEHAERERQGLE